MKYVSTFHGAIYALLLIALECMEEFEEEEVWLNRAMSHPMARLDAMAPTTAYYCFMGARLYCMTGRYEESRVYLRRYFDYLYKLKEDREAIERGAVLVAESVFQPHTVNGTLMCMEALIRLEDYTFAEEAFYLLDWEDEKLLHQDIWEKSILDACCSVAYHPLWVRMLQTLCSRKEGMKEMLVVFLEREIAYGAESEEEKLSRLCRMVADLDYEHLYILTKKILWAAKKAPAGNPTSDAARESGKEGDSESWACGQRIEDMFRQMFEKYPKELPNIRDEVWEAAERLGIPLEPLLLQVDAGLWSEALGQWCRSASAEDIQRFENRVSGWKTREDAHYDILKIRCMEGRLIQALKTAARQHLAERDYEAARNILLQVAQYAPEDEETKELLARIRER